MLLQYTIKAEIVNKPLNSIVNILKDHSVEYTQPEGVNFYENEHVLTTEHIYKMLGSELQDYLDGSFLTESDIDINTYEIVSRTEGVQIYFKNPENPSQFTMIPSVIAFAEEPSLVIGIPTGFQAELIEPTSIKWSFDEANEYAHYVIDLDGNIVANLPMGINYFIETGVKFNTNYTRLIIRYNQDGTSDTTDPVTITSGSPEVLESSYKPGRLSPVDLIRYETDKFSPVEENLVAFQSGIGDHLDLKVSKFKADSFFKRFLILTYCTATRRFNAPVYPPIPVTIGFHAEGEEPIKHWTGSLRFMLIVSQRYSARVNVRSTAYKPMPVKWQVCVDVDYEKINTYHSTNLERLRELMN